MKPQLVLQDLAGIGAHGKEIAKTRDRLLRTGAFKKQRVVVIVPAIDSIPAKVYLSHWNLVFPPNNGVARLLALGMEVGAAYSAAIEQVLLHPDLGTWEYLLTLEHDNLPPADGLLRLVERLEANPKLCAVSGLYFTKGEGGVAQIWGDPKDPILNFRPQLPDVDGGLVECCGLGMGFTLWRLAMFKDARLRRPWFVTQKKEGVMTQDLYAWSDLRKYGYRCAVDCGVKVGHLDSATDTIW